MNSTTNKKAPFIQDVDQFKKQIEKQAVILFSTKTCSSCVAFQPIFNVVVGDYPTAPIFQVDLDISKNIEKIVDIRGVPTVRLYQNGEITATLGDHTEKALTRLVKSTI